MKLPNKLFGVFFTLGLGGLLTGCESMFHDELSNCPQGVYVKFYTKTPCADTTNVGQVKDFYLFAFDKNNVLAGVKTVKDTTLERSKAMLMDNLPSGEYSFLAWAGVDDGNFTKPQFVKGTTKKSDLMLSLKQQAGGMLAPLQSARIYQGESPTVMLPEASENGSLYRTTAINMAEKTFRVHVEVVIDSTLLKPRNQHVTTPTVKPEEFSISIVSANGNMNIDGSVPVNSPLTPYAASNQYTFDSVTGAAKLVGKAVEYTDSSAIANFSVLDMMSGNYIAIQHKSTSGQTVPVQMDQEQADLYAVLKLYNKNWNPACVHDVKVTYHIKDKCQGCGTYMCVGVKIKEWDMISHETILN